MNKWVNKIENQHDQGEILYKIIQNCQMTYFGEKLGQLLVQLFLELNWIETN